jgi:hypothetical protein
MIPREVIVEMAQIIALILHNPSIDLNKLPEVEGVAPAVMAQAICASVKPEETQGCINRAVAISAAYVKRENKVYYNSFIIHPEASGSLGKSFILHELVHWEQDVDFSTLTCSQLKEKELEAYRVQDAYLAMVGEVSNFAGKFSERFVCRDKN